MSDLQMGTNETKFANLIWENEPITSSELARQSEALLGWKKTTSYTVLKRLCDKGIFQNEKGTVTSLISREEFFAIQSQQFVDVTFQGSLPAFFAAFTKRKALSAKEIDELRRMIDNYEEAK